MIKLLLLLYRPTTAAAAATAGVYVFLNCFVLVSLPNLGLKNEALDELRVFVKSKSTRV